MIYNNLDLLLLINMKIYNYRRLPQEDGEGHFDHHSEDIG